MRKYALLAAAAGLAVSGSLARADFVVSSTRSAAGNVFPSGSGSYDLVEFFAKSTNPNGVLTSENLKLTDTTGFNLVVGYTDNSEGTVDYAGTSMIHTNGTKSSPPTAYVLNNTVDQAGGPHLYSAINLLGDPTNTSENNAGGSLTLNGGNTPTAVSNSYTVQSITLQVANPAADNRSATDTLGVNASSANGGKGALVAIAVVPTGDQVNLAGTLVEGTAASQISANDPASTSIPEPASLGLLGLGTFGLLARRRRQA